MPRLQSPMASASPRAGPRRVRRLALLLAGLPAAASALDRFEIQVYQVDVNEPGQFGLETHANYTVKGETVPAYPGEVPPDGIFRLTFEPALGITRWLELGAYLQALASRGGGLDYGGFKLRAKLVVPREEEHGFFFGVNVEVGRVPVSVEEHGWANEIRPIVGWNDGTWLLDLNPIFGYALTGPDALRVDLEPAAKVTWNTKAGLALGLEWYAELGYVDALLPLSGQSHYLFAVLDLAPARGQPEGPWELNLGVGVGLGAADQQFLMKAIVGRAF